MIKSISIMKLFGNRDIKVEFFKDISLLVGRNGSGKTTVINILAAIATGNFFYLNRYPFKEIQVELGEDKQKRITVRRDNRQLHIDLGESQLIVDEREFEEFARRRHYAHENKMDSYMYHPGIQKLAKEINLLYIPLSRDTRFFNRLLPDEDYRRRYYSPDEVVALEGRPVSGIDETLDYVNQLFKEKHRKVMIAYDEINKDAQRTMFQASFRYLDESFSRDLQHKVEELRPEKISDLKSAFLEMGILNQSFDNKIDSFFNKLRERASLYKEVWSSKEPPDFNSEKYRQASSLLINVSLVDRIIEWIEIAQSVNKKKNEAYATINSFLDRVNEFLADSSKKLTYDYQEGVLYFRPIQGEKQRVRMGQRDTHTLDKLSSGEKQIVIFFAYLLFGIDRETGGTIVIDEPELSLHLAWQQRFSSAVTKLAPDLQFIFATHAPEIIGPYRDRCIIMGDK